MRECVSELRAGRGGAFRLHNNIGASKTVAGEKMRQKEVADRQWLSLGERDTDRFSPFFLALPRFTSSFFSLSFLLFCTRMLSTSLFLILSVFCSLYSSVLHPDLLLSLSVAVSLSSPAFFVTTILLSLPHR